ncbi:multiple epidermal growth factor-like domains 10 [Elysia marginata]|uniref:Multiple epidermal growth factor-like domains 10 n=1 Tax=Elysia marginata TaxID=1093978 RepID=A0AAV4IWG3_9GAST|nr:multiple epidermal growth factor-like domains 10 [Elysia marginata]
MLDIVEKESEIKGLSLNIAKTESMTISKKPQAPSCKIRRRNVALKQKAHQSSRYKPRGFSQAFQAGNAVDGGTFAVSKEVFRSTCTHTDPNEDLGWWTVEFSPPVDITRFILYNRDDSCCRHRLKNFRLTVQPAYEHNTSTPYKYTDTNKWISLGGHTVVPSPRIHIPAREVRIDVAENAAENRNNTILSLCEVEIFGEIHCPPGQFGLACERQCNCIDGENCFVHSGGCPFGCAPGYAGEDCWDCEAGRYGDDCLQICNATCGGDSSCDRNSGACSQGCHTGYRGKYCESECPLGTYGQDCAGRCSITCGGITNACDRVNGTCLESCDPGFGGKQCDLELSNMTFGHHCVKQCSDCNGDNNRTYHFDGVCTNGCEDGYWGGMCDSKCPTGQYGANCLQFCSRNCRGSDNACDRFNGTCTNGCEDGYQGDKCGHKCSNETYGPLCENECSENCEGYNNRSVCDPVGGACINGCKDGYWGGMCDSECFVFTWGKDCRESCSNGCVHSTCHHQTGECAPCFSGYTGSKCDIGGPYLNESVEGVDSATPAITVAAAVGLCVPMVVAVVLVYRYRPVEDVRETEEEDTDVTLRNMQIKRQRLERLVASQSLTL